MRPRKILEQQPQLAQAVGRHQMGVVDDGNEHFAGAMHAEGFLHEQPFAGVILPVELDLEGHAEDTQRIMRSMQGAVDDRRDDALLILTHEGLFEDGFTGSWFAEDQTQTALLGVDF